MKCIDQKKCEEEDISIKITLQNLDSQAEIVSNEKPIPFRNILLYVAAHRFEKQGINRKKSY